MPGLANIERRCSVGRKEYAYRQVLGAAMVPAAGAVVVVGREDAEAGLAVLGGVVVLHSAGLC